MSGPPQINDWRLVLTIPVFFFTMILYVNHMLKGHYKGKELNKITFVHCNLGRGRATLAAMSFLLKEGLDWTIALKKIKKRRFVYLNKKQMNFLEKFYKQRE